MIGMPNLLFYPPRLAAVHDAIAECDRCRRLRSYCRRVAAEKKRAHRDDTYWGRPVPGFGDPDARLLLIGLAPAAHGANRTGRPFTGDGSGDFLMSALHRTGFANIPTSRHPSDGLRLHDAYILSAVRCAPPDNKPAPDEIAACQPHLDAEWSALRRVSVVVALGRVAFDACLARFERLGHPQRPKPAFAHAAAYQAAGCPLLIASYHPSRQNTNTGRLTPAMLKAVFTRARHILQDRRRGLLS